MWNTEATETDCGQERKVIRATNCHISLTFVSKRKYDSFIFSYFDRDAFVIETPIYMFI